MEFTSQAGHSWLFAEIGQQKVEEVKQKNNKHAHKLGSRCIQLFFWSEVRDSTNSKYHRPCGVARMNSQFTGIDIG